MLEKKITDEGITPEFEEAIADFRELVGVYGYTEIISGLIDLAVGEKAVISGSPQFLKNYDEEEQVWLKEIFEVLKSEIKNRILLMSEKEQRYKIPEIEITYHSPQLSRERPRVQSPDEAYRVLRHNWSNQIEFQEEFNVLFLDNKNSVLGIFNASKGGQAATIVDAKVIFAAALKANSRNLILAHNHPSGNTAPSSHDLAVTAKLQEAAKLLDIRISDHLIVTRDGFFSFMQEGILEEEE